MKFNDPVVRARVAAHVTFAIETATFAFAQTPEPVNTDERMVKVLSEHMQMPIILQLLNFTLNLDYRLKNTLTGLDKEQLGDTEEIKSKRLGLEDGKEKT